MKIGHNNVKIAHASPRPPPRYGTARRAVLCKFDACIEFAVFLVGFRLRFAFGKSRKTYLRLGARKSFSFRVSH